MMSNANALKIIFLFFLCFPTTLYSSLVPEANNGSFYNKFVECITTATAPAAPIPKHQVSKIVYDPKNALFSSVLQAHVRNRRYNTTSATKPLLIVAPLQESHVPAAVVCARSAGVQLKTRSGGHDYEGLSYVAGSPFVILDMFNLRSIEVDMASETAWVQTGATLGELYYRIAEKSPVHGFPGGSCPTVGVGGHVSGAGYGNMIRQHGVTVDHVVDARVVDAKGRILDRKAMGEDLFWAIRGGGGGSFGVILAFKIRLVRVPKTVTYFRVERNLDQKATDVVLEYQKAVAAMESGLFIRLLLQPITPQGGGNKTVRITAMALFLGDSSQLISIMNKEIPALGLKPSDCAEMSWIQSVLEWANHDHKTTDPEILLNRVPEKVLFIKRKSDYVMKPIPREGLESLWKKMADLGDVGLVFNSYGGKLAGVSDDETPFPHRAGVLFKIQYSISWSEEGSEAEKVYLHQARELHQFMTRFVSENPRRAYLNYRDLDIGTTEHGPNRGSEARVYGTKYFNKNFDRLVKVKTMVDPDNFFRSSQSIPPLSRPRSRKQATSL